MLKREILEECRGDHVGLWAVVRDVREAFPNAGDEEVREIVLALMEEFLDKRLVVAGFPTPDGRRFDAWTTAASETISRIDDAWTKLRRDPDIGEVVWFTAIGIPEKEHVDS